MIALWRISRLTTNAFSNPARALAEISSGSTPPTNSESISPLCKPSIISKVVRPIFSGSDLTPQALCISTRALASLTGRPPGSRVPIAPTSRAPRSPARRGIQASFAPEDCESASVAESAPDDSHNRSPTKITDLEVNPEIFAINWDSLPAADLITSALSFLLPREVNGAIVVTFNPRLRTCLNARRKTIGDSSSGSKPIKTK